MIHSDRWQVISKFVRTYLKLSEIIWETTTLSTLTLDQSLNYFISLLVERVISETLRFGKTSEFFRLSLDLDRKDTSRKSHQVNKNYFRFYLSYKTRLGKHR